MTSQRIAILTPDPADREGFNSRWRSVLERTAEPLRAGGLIVEGRSWAEAFDLADFDLVLPLLVWGYHRAGESWREATEQWERQKVRTLNPPSVLRWNADKLYLRRLAERGAPVVPTLFVDELAPALLDQALETFEADRLIAKPQVSASAWQTIRWSAGDSLDGGPTGPALVQPYMPSIEKDGEISLIYVDGEFSHAIRKRPQPGDFRVQPEYDGIITSHQPDSAELSAAQRILAQVDETLLYARIDLVRGDDGLPLLMELELVEPDLYLEHDPGEGGAFTEAVARSAGNAAAAEGRPAI